ncbi:MAG: efflux RND transporter periplasmic adaptor subunit [Candidatus Komeilibacteria bacterium]
MTKKRWIIGSIILAVVVVVVIILTSGSPKKNYEYVLVQKADLRQEVSVTGSVKPAREVELALERSGRVAGAYVKVGDHVQVGQTLVALDSADVAAQLRQAEAGVQSSQAQLSQYRAALANQQAKLEELKLGARSEDVAVSQAALAKAEQDLVNYYLSVRNTLNDAYSKANDAVRAKTAAIFSASSQSYSFTFATCDAQTSYNATSGRYDSELELQAWQKELQSLSLTVDQSAYDQEINLTQNHLSKITSFLLVLNQVLTTSCTLADSNLDTYRTNVATAITNVNTANTNVATAEQYISAQQATVQQRRNELTLKQAGPTAEQLASQEAVVRQAQASLDSQNAMVAQQVAIVQNYQAQLAKNIIRAPFAGLITKQDAKVGQVTSPNTSLVSLISDKQYQIEANIPEADIAKIKIADPASLTLDAYGGDVTFTAKVVAIDPAETMIDGVSTYKVTLEFDQADDRIRSGMTANLDIATDSRTQVLAVPQRAVIAKDGEKFGRVLTGNEKSPTITEVKITTGMTASDGRIEIMSGLNEGDRVDISTQ